MDVCAQLGRMSHERKIGFLKENGICFGCLCTGHISKDCRKRISCSRCSLKHPTILHKEPVKDSEQTERSPELHVDNTLVSSGLTGAGNQDCKLPIVPVQVKSNKGTTVVITYAFLDQGSTAVFCTESLMQKLHLTGRKGRILLRTMGQEKVVSSNIVSGLEVAALEGDNFLELPRAYTQELMPVNRGNIPTERDIKQWSYLRDVYLPQIDAGIELLIGTNVPKALEPLEVVCSENDGPYAIRTLLGWTVNGPMTGNSGETVNWEHPEITVNRISVVNLDDLWQQQFKNDFPESSTEEQPAMSREDQRFMEFVTNSAQQVEGHYQIALPLRKIDIKMPNNKKIVEQRLCYLERRFEKDSTFHSEYNTFITDLLVKGYAVNTPKEVVKQELKAEENKKEPLCRQKQHRKVVDKGKPEDIMKAVKGTKERLPTVPLSGMYNKSGGKLDSRSNWSNEWRSGHHHGQRGTSELLAGGTSDTDFPRSKRIRPSGADQNPEQLYGAAHHKGLPAAGG